MLGLRNKDKCAPCGCCSRDFSGIRGDSQRRTVEMKKSNNLAEQLLLNIPAELLGRIWIAIQLIENIERDPNMVPLWIHPLFAFLPPIAKHDQISSNIPVIFGKKSRSYELFRSRLCQQVKPWPLAQIASSYTRDSLWKRECQIQSFVWLWHLGFQHPRGVALSCLPLPDSFLRATDQAPPMRSWDISSENWRLTTNWFQCQVWPTGAHLRKKMALNGVGFWACCRMAPLMRSIAFTHTHSLPRRLLLTLIPQSIKQPHSFTRWRMLL